MARTLAQGSEDRFAVEARETSDMLRQGDPTVIVGANGTRMMAYALPAKQSVSGEFPKVTPAGRFRSASPVAEVTGSDAKMMTDVAPVLFHNQDGSLFRIRGHSLARQNRHDWSVVWDGGNRWRCRGGIVDYRFEDIHTQITVPERNGPETIVTLDAGWIVLQVEGAQYDPTLNSSHFVPSWAEIIAVESLDHDFTYSLSALDNGTSAAAFGQFPIAWVGLIRGEPVIFKSYLFAEFPGVVCPAPDFIKPGDFCTSINGEDEFFVG